MRHALGIDLGGTSAKIALVNTRHQILKDASVPTAGFPDPAALAARLSLVAEQLAGRNGIAQVGVGVAGDIDSHRGIVRVSPNLGWKNVPLKKLIERRLKRKTTVENDAKVAAWGLYKTQAPAKVKNLIVMTLGTGVGGGLILNGQLYRGATGTAGEVGHMNIAEDGPLCNCGNRGCLETYVGGPHIVRKVRTALEAGEKSSLQAAFRENPDELTPLAVALAAQAGDDYAISVWNDVGHALGIAVGDLIYLLNPEMICFTGGVAQAKDLILKPMWEKVRERAFKTPVGAVTIKVAARASHIGVIGASLL